MENFNLFFDDDDWDDDEDWDDEPFSEFDQLIGDAQEQEAQNLYFALMDQPVKQLRAIAKRRGWKLKGTRKEELVEQITEQMLNGMIQSNFLDGLTAEEHEAIAILHTLFNLNNTLYLSQIQQVWAGALGRKKSIKPIIKGLETYGLIYECREHGSAIHYHPYLTIPAPLLPVFPVFPTRKLDKATHKTVAKSPNLLQQFEQFIALIAAGTHVTLSPRAGELRPEGHELLFVGNWPYLPNEVDKLPSFSPYFFLGGKKNYLTVPLRTEVLDPTKNKTLIEMVGDQFKIDWFFSLALQLQILVLDSRDDQDIALFNPEPWSLLLSMDSQERLPFLFQAWQSAIYDLHEVRKLLAQNKNMSLIRRPNPDIPYQAFLFDNMLTRKMVFRLLQGLVEDDRLGEAWHSFEQFAEDLYIYFPNYCHSLTSDVDWGFVEGRHVLELGKRKDWFKTYGRILHFIFTGPLYWFNVIELQKKGDVIHAFPPNNDRQSITFTKI